MGLEVSVGSGSGAALRVEAAAAGAVAAVFTPGWQALEAKTINSPGMIQAKF